MRNNLPIQLTVQRFFFETNQLLQKEQDENAVITATAGQLMKLLKKDIVVYLSDGKELATPNVFSCC